MRRLIATVAAMVAVLTAVPAHADPNQGEGGQGEASYLTHVKDMAPGLGKSDAAPLADGRRVCDYRRAGHESIDLPGIAGPEVARALTDLCPEVGDF
jgi:hypothetical protein